VSSENETKPGWQEIDIPVFAGIVKVETRSSLRTCSQTLPVLTASRLLTRLPVRSGFL
jgi:hypothetical protein